ncbi:NADH-quinone oxidoreductase subunit B [Candidatus Endoriftia persephone]|jgi:NADH-quinone oxidoreductase subunit B|uniref:NADH-ubiquinone oxidoreductase chain B n=2 Tax=Gammaproteobacteria TaxID=1236 RepID=G2DEW8_9GAMM|nr:NADH-quinone oxidoreductase subunit NuoB [Candidatus Endoriftia persephone]EGV50830.1 NADH-ubiquinone oxidoreductase chain B [endosymbiont of Riftia pachyptila (vent Ph05)]USF88835.1 NADH-quinone oxidoreductase subunit NuoB [Candidatus Endoriftia persephone]
MSDLKKIPVVAGRRGNPLARVFDELVRFCRSRSLFILHYCTGCGAIELPPAMTSRFDMERLGLQPMVSPRQADILLITGYVSIKTLKRVILTYEQMGSPKYVIGICSCTVNGGMYWQSYATAKKLDEYMPVDLYIAGCMPRPEAVITGLRQLMEQIRHGEANRWQDYYRRYDWYLGNQQHLFGDNWQTPTDVIAEAEHYGLIGDQTLGRHTALLQQHQKPLEALEMRLK